VFWKAFFDDFPELERGLEKWVRGKYLPHRIVFILFYF
jgi:hypothetical protein